MKRIMNRHPAKHHAFFLGMIPLVVVLVMYIMMSSARLAENPNDKLMPSMSAFAESMERLAFTENKRTGEYIFWGDSLASLKRLATGIFVSAMIGLVVGVLTGFLPLMRASFTPLITTISLIPPMAILPILFIIFGLGELSKVMLIVIGTAPFLVRDMQSRVLEIPQEMLVKAQTLGANTWQTTLRVVLPQVLPRLLESVRLSLGAAWLFLIAAEAIAATEGLGYRIFLVRRYLAMDTILPYVAWITLLAFFMDWMLLTLARKCFPWYYSISNKAEPVNGTSGSLTASKEDEENVKSSDKSIRVDGMRGTRP